MAPRPFSQYRFRLPVQCLDLAPGGRFHRSRHRRERDGQERTVGHHGSVVAPVEMVVIVGGDRPAVKAPSPVWSPTRNPALHGYFHIDDVDARITGGNTTGIIYGTWIA